MLCCVTDDFITSTLSTLLRGAEEAHCSEENNATVKITSTFSSEALVAIHTARTKTDEVDPLNKLLAEKIHLKTDWATVFFSAIFWSLTEFFLKSPKTIKSIRSEYLKR